MTFSRREWIKFAGGISVAATGTTLWPHKTRAGNPATNAIRLNENHRQLFLDDSLIASRHHVVRTVHQAMKHPEPVLVGDRPWEGPIVAQPVVWFSPERNIFQMWYMQDWYAPPPRNICYAESSDGIHWEKPDLGKVEWRGSTDNNIVWPERITQGWIMLDVHAKDPAKRYKGLNQHFKAMYSPDGIHWTEGEHVTGMIEEDDGPGLFYDKSRQKYVFVKRAMDRSIFRRMSHTAFSSDFIHWEVHPHIFAPDERDAARAAERGAERVDFYSEAVVPYEGFYLGWVDCFYLSSIGQVGTKNQYHDGVIESELMWSRDAVHWIRVAPGQPVIPRGPVGAFDHGFVMISMSPIVRENEVWLYYTGAKCTHACGGTIDGRPALEDHDHGQGDYQSMSIGLARWKLDRFVSLDADDTFRNVITKPITFSGRALTINASVTGGAVQVELQNEGGKAIEGYQATRSDPIRGDSLAHAVTWAGQPSLPDTRPLRLRFRMRNASLFSFNLR